ncbi:MAG: hypothetical protein AAF492_30780, partial [Verrucomicrobiota bacterium]
KSDVEPSRETERAEARQPAPKNPDRLNAIPDYAEIRDEYEARVKKAEEEFERKKAELAAKYLDGLNRYFIAYRNQGAFDAAVAIRDEIERFTREQAWPENVNETLPPEVTSIQVQAGKYMVLYEMARDEEVDKAKEEFAEKLLLLVKRFTRAGKMEEAVLIREVRNKLLFGP